MPPKKPDLINICWKQGSNGTFRPRFPAETTRDSCLQFGVRMSVEGYRLKNSIPAPLQSGRRFFAGHMIVGCRDVVCVCVFSLQPGHHPT